MFMLFDSILKYNVRAKDDELGKVKDVFYDLNDWSLKYLVIDTRKWLPGKKVLVSPQCVSSQDPFTTDGYIQVELTRNKIENGPAPDEKAIVKKKMIDDINNYYNWQPFWVGGANAITPPMAEVPFYYHHVSSGLQQTPPPPEEDMQRVPQENQMRMRSCSESLRYRVKTEDDKDCRVRDFLLDVNTWRLLYIVVDTGELLGGNTTLIPHSLVDDISWFYEKVRIKVTKEQVENAPTFDLISFDESYESQLLGYYFKDDQEITARERRAG